jgi:hypothetical protein
MSLYKFVESNLTECPELLLLSNSKTEINYNSIYNFYRSKEKRFPIQSFLDILLHDSLSRCSQNVVEYELLKQKTRKIAGLLQSKFDLKIATELNSI